MVESIEENVDQAQIRVEQVLYLSLLIDWLWVTVVLLLSLLVTSILKIEVAPVDNRTVKHKNTGV